MAINQLVEAAVPSPYFNILESRHEMNIQTPKFFPNPLRNM